MSRSDALHELLLAWFATSKRDLPWRRTRDPYAIWLSEVMLQQTQVVTVIPYWHRYLERFPTVEALAAAPVDDVLALWSGLGYYARARNLHRAAQEIVDRHGGRLPADLDALRALSGFGPYTAAAVASIAFDLDAPLVDGNVARVLCRLEGWEMGAEEARQQAWSAAEALLPQGRAGDWNQALMELGATVCSPSSPACDRCPVQRVCRAAESGEPARFPLPKVRRPRRLLRLAAVCVRGDDDEVVLVRQQAKGLFGGLWSLPHVDLGELDEQPAAMALAHSLVGQAARLERRGTVSHTLTHRDVVVEVFNVEGTPQALPEDARLVPVPALPSLGLSTLAVKLMQTAGVDVPEGHGRRRSKTARATRGDA